MVAWHVIYPAPDAQGLSRIWRSVALHHDVHFFPMSSSGQKHQPNIHVNNSHTRNTCSPCRCQHPTWTTATTAQAARHTMINATINLNLTRAPPGCTSSVVNFHPLLTPTPAHLATLTDTNLRSTTPFHSASKAIILPIRLPPIVVRTAEWITFIHHAALSCFKVSSTAVETRMARTRKESVPVATLVSVTVVVPVAAETIAHVVAEAIVAEASDVSHLHHSDRCWWVGVTRRPNCWRVWMAQPNS